MDVTCPECNRGFFISEDVWDHIVADVSTHQSRTCPHCGEGMCFTCQFVPAHIFAAQGVQNPMMSERSPDRNRRSSRRRTRIQKPNYPF